MEILKHNNPEERGKSIDISLLFSCSVVSNFLWPRGLQNTRLPCPSLSPRVCSNSCPLSWWCFLTISSSFAAFSFCLQSFPASRSFSVSQLFTSGGQNSQVSASVLSVYIQGWFPLGVTGLISLQTHKSLLQDHNSNALIVYCSAFFMV